MSSSKTGGTTVDEFQDTEEYKELVGVGIEARQKRDVSNWELGDAAQEVVQRNIEHRKSTEHGEDDRVRAVRGEKILVHYAVAIGVNYKSLCEYKRISVLFDNSSRLELPTLSWSHFQVVSKQTKIARPKWLQDAQDNSWTVQEFEDAIDEDLGKKTSKQKTLERVLDLAGMSPAESLREILRLMLGHRADVGVELVVVDMRDIKHTLPMLVDRDLDQLAAGAQYLTEIYDAVKGAGN